MPEIGEKRRKDPPPLTGGVWRTQRDVPKLPKAKVTKGYGRIIASGFDTLEETFDMQLDISVIEALEQAKKQAKDNGDKDPVPIELAGRTFHVAGFGAQGGTKYILTDGVFLIRIRNPKQPWPVSVRYLAGALWAEGIDDLRYQLIHEILRAFVPLRTRMIGSVKDKSGITDSIKRADFAFDFYAPGFSREMKGRKAWRLMEQIVAHKEVKFQGWGTSGGLETITIGSKASLQVQVYDKGKEIDEASGKTWMFDLWRDNGWPGPDEKGRAKDVWRLECRFTKNFLRERGINILDNLREDLSWLIAEALYTRRLTKPTRDSNERRWPLHPIWAMAADREAAKVMPPIGKRITLRRSALMQILEAQAIGVIRAYSVLANGDFTEDEIEELEREIESGLRKAVRIKGKTENLKERYRNIDKMR